MSFIDVKIDMKELENKNTQVHIDGDFIVLKMKADEPPIELIEALRKSVHPRYIEDVLESIITYKALETIEKGLKNTKKF